MYTDQNGSTWYKVQLHIHTTLSDGNFTPEQAAALYKSAGFDAVAFTDHWKYHGADEIAGVTVIPGCEYHIGASDTADGVMHIVGLGMNIAPDLTYGESTRQQVIDGIFAAGGMAVLAHPAWSLNTVDDVKALHGFEALEIYNSVSDAGQSSRPYSGYLVDLLANEGITLPLLATDDIHLYDGSDGPRSFIMVKADACTPEDILHAVKTGDFYASQGPTLAVNREGKMLTVTCSDCVMINFLSNLAWADNRMHKGETLTQASYQIKSNDKWVRVEIMDKDGRYAWSNIIRV